METMPNDVMERSKTPPSMYETEADNILTASHEDCGFGKLAKFKKGQYFVNDDEIPLGTEFVAHANQWTYCWLNFMNGKVTDRRMSKVAEGIAPPRREDLGDNDPSKWETGLDGKPKNPWSLQYLLPLENLENGEVLIFTTGSVGGKMGVAELCRTWARRAKKGLRALPIVKLSAIDMPTKVFGPVPRPHFRIVNWDEAAASSIEVIPFNAASDLDDEIPF
jgi:hypothetical protein